MSGGCGNSATAPTATNAAPRFQARILSNCSICRLTGLHAPAQPCHLQGLLSRRACTSALSWCQPASLQGPAAHSHRYKASRQLKSCSVVMAHRSQEREREIIAAALPLCCCRCAVAAAAVMGDEPEARPFFSHAKSSHARHQPEPYLRAATHLRHSPATPYLRPRMLSALNHPLATQRSVAAGAATTVSETRDVGAAVAEAAAALVTLWTAAAARLRHWAWTAWEVVGAMYLSMRYFTGELTAVK